MEEQITNTDVTTIMDGEYKCETQENGGFEVTHSNENNIIKYINDNFELNDIIRTIDVIFLFHCRNVPMHRTN